MFFVNIFRIVLIFMLGTIVFRVLDSLIAMRLLHFVFHAHIGWLLYCVSILVYAKVILALEGWIKTKQCDGLTHSFKEPLESEC